MGEVNSRMVKVEVVVVVVGLVVVVEVLVEVMVLKMLVLLKVEEVEKVNCAVAVLISLTVEEIRVVCRRTVVTIVNSWSMTVKLNMSELVLVVVVLVCRVCVKLGKDSVIVVLLSCVVVVVV